MVFSQVFVRTARGFLNNIASRSKKCSGFKENAGRMDGESFRILWLLLRRWIRVMRAAGLGGRRGAAQAIEPFQPDLDQGRIASSRLGRFFARREGILAQDFAVNVA